MPRPLKVLLIEDTPNDAELVIAELQQAGFEPVWRRVDTEEAFREALGESYELILSDYRMPRFTGLRALELLRESGREIPFILISGTIGEEAAVAAMRDGASDYLLKDRLARLGQAVDRALEQGLMRHERRRTNQLMREAAASMEAAQEVGHFGSWEIELGMPTGHAQDTWRWSPQCFRIFGFEPGEVTESGELFHSLVHPDDREEMRLAMASAIARRQRFLLEHRIVRRSGEVRQVRETARVFFDPAQDRPLKMVGTIHDITEEHRATAALRQTHAQLHHLVARSPTVIYQEKWAEDRFRAHFFSENVAVLTGFSAEEICHPAWWETHVHPDDRPTADAATRAAVQLGTSRAEYRIRRKDGTYVWLEDRKRLLPALGDAPWEMVGGWTDITARKQAEEDAREIGERFRQVVENIHEAFWLADAEQTQLFYVSPAAERIWGRSCQSLYDAPEARLAAIAAEDRERVRAVVAAARGGEYDAEYRITRPDGAVRWIRERAFAVRDENDEVRRLAGVAEDITERKALEEQFLRAQRMEVIGALASGVAHDLNNILAPVLMAPTLLAGAVQSEQDKKMLALIEQGARRGTEVVRQLLTFSRGSAGERVAVQVKHLITEMRGIVTETFPREIRFELDVEKNLPAVFGDATQIHQMLLNLCVNARDAMPAGGTLTLGARRVLVSAEQARLHPPARPGPFVVITVSDTGQGIPPEIIERIFDPFFTTKEPGKGTGLGLSTVLGLVRGHGGFVTVESQVGRGSAFGVHLPLAPVDDAESTPPSEGVARRGHGELVLVVDDEPQICETCALTLGRLGYRVITASDGAVALRLFEARRAEVAVVVTDIMMPRMGGVELIAALRRLNPSVKVVVFSGMMPEAKRQELEGLGLREVLRKPYELHSLLDAIHRALTPPAA